jgi:Immunity protein 42
MYTFGDVQKFAISYELDENQRGSWLFGKFCYWVGGEVIGDYELIMPLCYILPELRHMVIDNGNRENINLFKLSSEEFCTHLDNFFCGEGDEELGERECWARFLISPSVDIFDGWAIYLIDSPPISRIIYSFQEENVVEFNLESGAFDQVITNVFNTLFDIYESQADASQTLIE